MLHPESFVENDRGLRIAAAHREIRRTRKRVQVVGIDREDRSIGLESAHVFTELFIVRGQQQKHLRGVGRESRDALDPPEPLTVTAEVEERHRAHPQRFPRVGLRFQSDVE